MSYKTDLQSNNVDLQAILTKINALPGASGSAPQWRNINTLPSSTDGSHVLYTIEFDVGSEAILIRYVEGNNVDMDYVAILWDGSSYHLNISNTMFIEGGLERTIEVSFEPSELENKTIEYMIIPNTVGETVAIETCTVTTDFNDYPNCDFEVHCSTVVNGALELKIEKVSGTTSLTCAKNTVLVLWYSNTSIAPDGVGEVELHTIGEHTALYNVLGDGKIFAYIEQ